MAEYTQNYSLKKPLPNEFYDVADQNSNMDKIDSALKKHDDLLDKKVDLDETGKIPQEQLPELDFIKNSEKGQPNGVAPLNEDGVLDIIYGGTKAKTAKQACKNLNAMSDICAYYSGEDSDGILDTLTDSTIIIPITRDINAELYNLIGGNWGYVYQTFFDEKTTTTRRVQLVISTGTGKIACRHYEPTLQKWQDWTVQATTQKPIEYVLALSDEFSPSGISKYFKTEDGVVTVSFNIIHNTSFIANGWGTVVATLPVGFRPNSLLYLPAIARKTDNTLISAMAGIKATGEIEFTVNSSDSLKNATASFSFIAGN